MKNSITRWLPAALLMAAACRCDVCSAASVAGVSCLRLDKFTASNLFSEAAALMENGRTQEVVSVYNDIIQSGRFNRDIHEALYRKGLYLQAMKQDQEAIACWKILLGKYTNTEWHDDALLEMGKIYALNLNQPEKAFACYERLIREYPGSERLVEAQFQLGVAAYMKGNYRKARVCFETALKKDPQGGLSGEAQEWLNRTTGAMTGVLGLPSPERSAQAGVRNSLTPSGLSKPTSKQDTSSRKTSGLQRDLSAEVAKAEAMQNKGDYKEALKAFQPITRNFMRGKGYDRALFRMGQCQAALGNEQDAMATWGEVLRLVQMKQPCEYADDSLLAQADTWLNALDNPDKAFACCQTLQTEYPDSDLIPQAEHLIGLVYFHQGELDKARDIFEQELARRGAGLAKNPQPAGTNALALRSSQSEGGPLTGLERLIAACGSRQAAGLFKAGMKNTPRPDPMIQKGDMQFTAKDYGKARQNYERAIRKAPGTEQAAYALLQAGRCLNQMRQYRQALWCYEQFLTKYRQSQYADDALLRAGVIYVGPLRNMAAGAKLYITILERYPDSNEAETAQYHLATLAYWKKEFSKALALYQQVAETWPEGKYADFVNKKRLPEIQTAMARHGTRRTK